jgi:excinuclease UvrABC nuclease subunit
VGTLDRYLEKKDRKRFESLLPSYRNAIGDSSGIYALYGGKELYYVGVAKNLLWRVYGHTRDKHRLR